MIKTTPHKKIEILVDAPLLRRIRDFAAEYGATSYTVLPTLGGEGGQGRWWDDQVTGGAGSKVILTMIVDDTTAASLFEVLSPLIKSYGLLVTVMDVEVVGGAETPA